MGQSLPQDSLLTMMDGKLASYHLNNTRLRIIQGNSIGSEDLKTTSSAMLRDMYSVTQATITSQQRTIDSLQRLTSGTARLDTMSLAISPELKVIFPQVSKIAIAHTVECDITTRHTDTLTIALVEYNTAMSGAERHKFEAYLQARLSIPSLRIINAHIP